MVGGLARILLATAIAGPLVGRVKGKRVGVLVLPQSRADLEAVTALVAQGAVTPRIDRVYPLSDALAAFARLAAGQAARTKRRVPVWSTRNSAPWGSRHRKTPGKGCLTVHRPKVLIRWWKGVIGP